MSGVDYRAGRGPSCGKETYFFESARILRYLLGSPPNKTTSTKFLRSKPAVPKPCTDISVAAGDLLHLKYYP